MVMYDPPHPGEVIREFWIEPLGLSVTKAAEGLGVSRTSLSELLNGRRGISPEMAIRLSTAFGGSAESWVTQQAQYDLGDGDLDLVEAYQLLEKSPGINRINIEIAVDAPIDDKEKALEKEELAIIRSIDYCRQKLKILNKTD